MCACACVRAHVHMHVCMRVCCMCVCVCGWAGHEMWGRLSKWNWPDCHFPFVEWLVPGAAWGDGGYILLGRGSGANAGAGVCGINLAPIRPTGCGSE